MVDEQYDGELHVTIIATGFAPTYENELLNGGNAQQQQVRQGGKDIVLSSGCSRGWEAGDGLVVRRGGGWAARGGRGEQPGGLSVRAQQRPVPLSVQVSA